MRSVQKVVIARTVLLLILVLIALGFSVAVALDDDEGTLLDRSGIITPATVEKRP